MITIDLKYTLSFAPPCLCGHGEHIPGGKKLTSLAPSFWFEGLSSPTWIKPCFDTRYSKSVFLPAEGVPTMAMCMAGLLRISPSSSLVGQAIKRVNRKSKVLTRPKCKLTYFTGIASSSRDLISLRTGH